MIPSQLFSKYNDNLGDIGCQVQDIEFSGIKYSSWVLTGFKDFSANNRHIYIYILDFYQKYKIKYFFFFIKIFKLSYVNLIQYLHINIYIFFL